MEMGCRLGGSLGSMSDCGAAAAAAGWKNADD